MARTTSTTSREHARGAAHEGPQRCLFCRSALPPIHGAGARCGACDNVNLRVDQRAYWTLAPRAVTTERYLRIAGTVVMAVATFMLMMTPSNPRETGMKTFALMGMLIPTALWWDLSSLRTRKVSRSRFEVFVPAMFLLVSVFPISWALLLVLWGQSPDIWSEFIESLGLLLYAQPFAFASWMLVRSVRWLRRREREAFHSPLTVSESADVERAISPVPAPPPSSAPAVRAMRAARGLINTRPSSSYGSGLHSTRAVSCLHCFHTLAPMKGSSQSCPRCQRTTRKVDQAIYWTRHEDMVDAERRTKAIIASMFVVATAATYLNAAKVSEMSMWAVPTIVVAALAIAALAWDIAGMMTRHRSMLRLEWLLPWGVGTFGFAAVLFGRLAMEGKPGLRNGGIRDTLEIPWTFGIPFVIAGLMLHLLMRWFLDWREETRTRLASSSETGLGSGSGLPGRF